MVRVRVGVGVRVSEVVATSVRVLVVTAAEW